MCVKEGGIVSIQISNCVCSMNLRKVAVGILKHGRRFFTDRAQLLGGLLTNIIMYLPFKYQFLSVVLHDT